MISALRRWGSLLPSYAPIRHNSDSICLQKYLPRATAAKSFLLGPSSPAKRIEIKLGNLKEKEMREELMEIVASHFEIHPFATGLTKENAKHVMRCYLAMSEAFPYIQAGAHRDLLMDAIRRNVPMEPKMEKTFVVGSFLTWDETGGQYLLKTEGISALPKILDTRNFHSRILKKDLATIFKEKIEPNYCTHTHCYLTALGRKLGVYNHTERCAMMVAFELHAGQMIEALWHSLSTELELNKEDLEYFKIHVGGDDPGEAYHIEMVKNLMQSIVDEEHKSQFFTYFKRCYHMNIEWCKAICKMEERV